MRAFRHSFLGGVFEIRTSVRADGQAVAEIFTVQETSMLLLPYSENGSGDFVRSSEDDAHSAALLALEERFGRQSCKPSVVPEDSGFRVVGRARTA